MPGRIFVASPDRHLLLLEHRVRLSLGPSENGHRPAIDPLFRSVARAAGSHAIAVVLSGNRDDGAVGAATIAARGGTVVVQSPQDALHAAMPSATIARVAPDHVATAVAIGPLLSELVATAHRLPMRPVTALLDAEVAMSNFAPRTTDRILHTPGGYGCPSCGGSLFELPDQPVPHFRCRVGHAWSPESLLDEQAVATEGALWTALRALEEKSALARRMAGSRAGNHDGGRFEQMATDADHAGALIRVLLGRLGGSTATQGE